MSRDVIIVGGGMAGLVAGIAAAEAGASVTVLEAGEDVGGTMAMSGGLIWSPVTIESARRWIPRGDEGHQRIAVSETRPGWEWLESHGLPLGPESPCLKHDMGLGRMMGLGEAGDRSSFAAVLADRARELGNEIELSAVVTGASADGGRWTVTWSRDGEEHTSDADALIFASGGFHNSKELVGRYITTAADQLVIRGNKISDGIALRVTVPLGAEISAGMHSFYGHTFPWVDGHVWEREDYLDATMPYTDYCVLLNQLGLRFKDESVGSIDEHNAQMGSRQPGGRYYVVFDDRIREERVDADLVGIPGLPTTRMSNRVNVLKRFGTRIVNEPDLVSLSASMEREFGVPAANALDSIRTYNETADPILQLDPPRREYHAPLVHPPFWAVPSVAAITYTLGGLRVNAEMAVQGTGFGAPIYAAGADAGNVYEDVYGGGLAWALVSGRRAGTAAAGGA